MRSAAQFNLTRKLMQPDCTVCISVEGLVEITRSIHVQNLLSAE